MQEMLTKNEKRIVSFLNQIKFTDECWLWNGFIHPKGYGRFRFNENKTGQAHRFSYTMFVGEIDQKFEIDHLCRNKICVNPGHLEQVTHRENVLRGEGLASQNNKKRFCPKGHLYDSVNTHSYKDGKRRCRKCLYIQGRLSEKGFKKYLSMTVL